MTIDWFPFAVQNRAPTSLWGAWTGGPSKGVLHTTETDFFTPDIDSYFGHTSYPHFTIVLNKDWTVTIYQHIPLTRAARALKNLSGGAQTNTDSAIQIEIVWRASNAHNMPRQLLDTIRALMRWLEHECSIQPVWYENQSHFYPPEDGHRLGYEPWRMSAAEWEAWNGWCGHCNVPENVHGDPGKIDIAYLFATPEGIDMPKPTDITAVAQNPIGASGFYMLEAQGGVRAVSGVPFFGSMFNLPPERRIMDSDEWCAHLIIKTDSARTKITGYKVVTNKGDGYDFPVTA